MTRDILTVSNGGATISHIMFKAYLSHSQAKSYLGQLIETGFMELDSVERKYRTTHKGIEYLQAADRMAEIFSINIRRSSSDTRKSELAFQF